MRPSPNGANGRRADGQFAKGNPGGDGNPFAKHVMAMAAAAQVYSKRVGASQEVQNSAAEIHLRAERMLGAILKQTPMNPGTKGQLKGDVVGGTKLKPPTNRTPTLEESGNADGRENQREHRRYRFGTTDNPHPRRVRHRQEVVNRPVFRASLGNSLRLQARRRTQMLREGSR